MRYLYCALLALCLQIASPAAPEAVERLSLSAGWVFATDPENRGLAEGRHSPQFDDSSWRPIRIDATYESQGVSYDGYSWYRLRFDVPEEWTAAPVMLDLGPIDDADETYLNGHLVGRTGPMGDPAVTFWTHPRLYVLEPAALRQGAENVLAIRVWDQRGGGGVYQGPVSLSRTHSLAGDVVHVAREPWGLQVAISGGTTVRLQVYPEGILRVRMAPDGVFGDWLAEDVVLADPEPKMARFGVRDYGDHLRLNTGRVRVRVDLRPFRLSFRDARGRLLTRQSLGAWRAAGWVGEGLTCRRDEHFLGLGQPGPHIDRRGHIARMWVIHSYQAEDIPVPFYLSSAGYGLLLCNSFDSYLGLTATRPGAVDLRVAGGEMDYFIIPGPEPKDIISSYTLLTGRSPLPPRWAFGYWQSRAGHGLEGWVKGTVERLRENGFPLDVLHMDGWSDGDLWFSGPRFSNPEGLMRWLDNRGVKLCIWETPFVPQRWQMHAKGLRSGYFARRDDGEHYPVNAWVGKELGLIDFLNPVACRWWQEGHRRAMDVGVAAVKTDGGDTKEVPADAVFHHGRTGHEVHNLYPLLFNRCVYEGQQRMRPGKRVINWTRTGFAGIQRYPCTWGGDEPSTFAGGRTLVRAGINAGACGIAFWSHDLGGFAYGRTKEYYVRSCQWGFLSPLARVHGMGQNADKQIVGNEPWVFGPQAEKIVRKYARLRYRLLPYLYSYAHEASRTGIPMMRALPLEFPDDPHCYRRDYQYMLGRQLMIAPIVNPSDSADLAASRGVYLPEGVWQDYWSARRWTGPCEITYAAAFDTLPVFVRAGSVIPYGPDVEHIGGPPSPELIVDAYVGGGDEFELVEDDGVSLDYRDGRLARTRISHRSDAEGNWSVIQVGAPKGHYDGMPGQRVLTFRIHGLRGRPGAWVNGKAVACHMSEATGALVIGPLRALGAVRLQVGRIGPEAGV